MSTFAAQQIEQLIFDLEYLKLAQIRSASRFLQKLVRDATELESMLRRYPHVRYEPLECHYLLLKYRSALTTDLLEDLCSGAYNWRGVVSAAWLACLRPGAASVAPLIPWTATAPEPNRWLIALAIAESNGTAWDGPAEIPALLRTLRMSLADLPSPAFTLRRSRSTENMLVTRARVGRAYHAGGLSAARSALGDETAE